MSDFLQGIISDKGPYRIKYGDDPFDKPEGDCFWDGLTEAWMETDKSFLARMKEHLIERNS